MSGFTTGYQSAVSDVLKALEGLSSEEVTQAVGLLQKRLGRDKYHTWKVYMHTYSIDVEAIIKECVKIAKAGNVKSDNTPLEGFEPERERRGAIVGSAKAPEEGFEPESHIVHRKLDAADFKN